MAEPCPFIEEDLLCSMCCDLFRFPVTLQCGHNFCKACIQSHWEWKGSRLCALCRCEESTPRPPINLALKIATDAFQRQGMEPPVSSEELCPTHHEKFKLFCLKEAKPICVVCQSSREHRNHQCCPLAEAVSDRKTELSSRCRSLKTHLHTVEHMKRGWEDVQSYIQRQTDETAQLIKEKFEELHRFLMNEEATRLTMLREEESRRTQEAKEKLEEITKQAEELSSSIKDIEMVMGAEDLQFLKDFKEAINRSRCTILEPQPPTGALIDSAQYLKSLKFSVGKSMMGISQHCPLTLDPNTAHPNLILSDEFTSVQYGKRQPLPDNPERCTNRMAVLAAAGYSSGRHSWEVDVGENAEWYVGVANESISRKAAMFLSPSEGFWGIGRPNGDACWAQTSPRIRLELKRKAQKIRVDLDHDKGKLTFSDATDGTSIYTFKDKFTERMFPYFALGINEGETPLKICPLNVSVASQ